MPLPRGQRRARFCPRVKGEDRAFAHPTLCSRSVTFPAKRVKQSHHFKDIEPHDMALACSGGERQNPIKPFERGVASLEPHRGAEVIERRVNLLAAAEAGYHPGRAVAVHVPNY